jgi:hypothetical protein
MGIFEDMAANAKRVAKEFQLQQERKTAEYKQKNPQV